MRMGAGVYVWLKLGMAIAVLWYSCTAAAQKSGCGDSCQTLNDCPGQLVCVDGKCTDDPDVGSHVCSDPGSGSGSGSGNGNCKASGHLTGRTGKCNRQHDSDCCVAGKEYPQYHCSPSISDNTPATMTINSFAKGGDGGGASECDGRFHDDDEMVVALSTGWYNGGSRCLNNIRITANGVTVQAMVVDECDSVNGCDSDHDFQPPCPNNVVDASPAVWDALGIHGSDVGDYEITWSDAS